jgi:nicotinamidase-related amidase
VISKSTLIRGVDTDRVSREGLVVILMDMQTNLTDVLPRRLLNRLVVNQKKILEDCKKHDVPVIVVEYRGQGRTIKSLRKALKNIPRKETISKSMDNVFLEDAISRSIYRLGGKTLLLAGIYSGACLKQASRTARRKGYEVIVSQTLIGDYRHEHTLVRSRIWEWYIENTEASENYLRISAEVTQGAKTEVT